MGGSNSLRSSSDLYVCTMAHKYPFMCTYTKREREGGGRREREKVERKKGMEGSFRKSIELDGSILVIKIKAPNKGDLVIPFYHTCTQ